MRWIRRFPFGVFVLGLLGIIGYSVHQGSLELLLVAGIIAVISRLVTQGPRARLLPTWVSNVLVLAAIVSMARDVLSPPVHLPDVLGRFTLWLLLIKLFELRRARDHVQVICLSFMLMLVGCLRTPPQLLFGVVLFIHLLVTVVTLGLFPLYQAHERHMARAADGELVVRRPVTGFGFRRHFAGVAAFVCVAALFGSLVVFVLLPRRPLHGYFSSSLAPAPVAAFVGYRDDIQLLHGMRLTSVRRPVMEIQFQDLAGNPVRLGGTIYLRGAVLDHYRAGQWTREEVPATYETDGEGIIRLPPAGSVGGRAIRQIVRMRQPGSRLFSVGVPIQVSLSPGLSLDMDVATRTLSIPEEEGVVREYAIDALMPAEAEYPASSTSIRRGPPTGFRDMGWAAARAVRDLAVTLLEQAGIPRDPQSRTDWEWRQSAAETFRAYLQGPEFTYTLDMSAVDAPEGDPVEHFLLHSRRGHCEYFASALVALCQAVGVDARIVSGYAVQDDGGADGVTIVPASAAHAWAEVRLSRDRWRLIDPTPPGYVSIEVPPAAGVGGRIEWLYERVEAAWTDGFVSFDRGAQNEILEAIGAEPGRFSRWWQNVRERARMLNQQFGFGIAGYLWALATTVLLLSLATAIFAVLLRQRHRLRQLHLPAMPWRRARAASRQFDFYLEMLAILRRAGCPKHASQPPRAFAVELAHLRPAAGPIVVRLVDRFYLARFGGTELSEAQVIEARQWLAELRGALR